MCYTAQLDTGGLFPFSFESIATWELTRPFPHFVFQNAAARPEVPVVTMDDPGRFGLARWLLVPPWIESAEKLKTLKIWTANARIEELQNKPLYRPLIESNRCIVVFTGFYEWRHEPDGSKTRYLLKLPEDKPLVLPGLYRRGMIDDEPYWSCTVCTMEAKGIMRYIHNSTLRQPVVTGRPGLEAWLDGSVSFYTARQTVLENELSGDFVAAPPVGKAGTVEEGTITEGTTVTGTLELPFDDPEP
jgi:putative SOS response-associated peptidase YedK